VEEPCKTHATVSAAVPKACAVADCWRLRSDLLENGKMRAHFGKVEQGEFVPEAIRVELFGTLFAQASNVSLTERREQTSLLTRGDQS
jgi:hypothetical protein